MPECSAVLALLTFPLIHRMTVQLYRYTVHMETPLQATGHQQEQDMTINVRGTLYEENLNNTMGFEFYDLSHPWGLGQPCWPYFEDVKMLICN